MAGFIYAVPGNNVNAKILEAAGLDKTFKSSPYTQRGCASGPAGGACTLICLGEESKKLFYKPAEQNWSKSLNGKFDIGFYINEPPAAQELERTEQIAGHIVTLAGQPWRIPLARIFPEGTCLPQSLLMGPDGKLISKVIPEYAEFSARCEKLWQYVSYTAGITDEQVEISTEDLWQTAVEALGLNYFIGADEANAMSLITTASMQKIFEAIVDVPTILKMSKKMAEDQKKTGEDKSTINDG